MLHQCFNWISYALSAIQDWFVTIASGIDFDLIGFLVAGTCLSIAISYLLAPAVGSSTKANSRHNRPNKKEK